ncbi:MAG: Crp/Fnr family transcriptional regulator [Flavobacteriaceae bacterium]
MYELDDLEQKDYNINQKLLLKKLTHIANHNDSAHLVHVEMFEKGSFLIKEKQAVKGYYFILDGKVKVFNTAANHKMQILKLAIRGCIIGLSGFNSTCYGASALAEDNVTAYFISESDFKDFLSLHQDLSLLLIKTLAFKVRHYEIRQKHLSLFPATERIVDSLLLIATKFGTKTPKNIVIKHCVSRKDISSFSGVSLENTIRTLSKLQKDKYITITPGMITIENKEALVGILRNHCCPNSHHQKGYCYIN